MITLLFICLIRALLFKPKPEEQLEPSKTPLNENVCVDNLAKLIRCKTISNVEKEKEDEKEFQKLFDLLPKLYPNVYKNSEFQMLGNRELLFHIKGKNTDHSKASIFMAHYDVVPTEEGWTEDPFGGVKKDGVLWGRGTIDTKGTFNGVLTSADELLKNGFVPNNDIYLAFSGEEEIGGKSAIMAIDYFKENNIEPLFVLDEGGAVVNNVFPGVSQKTSLIGTCEKGALSYEFKVTGEGGHASAPKAPSPLGKLALVSNELESQPQPVHLIGPVKEMFDTLGRHTSFKYRFIFANLWLFKNVLGKIAYKQGGQLNALLRTTIALTEAKGAPQNNVIPENARLGINCRILPPENVDTLKNRFEEISKKYGVTYSGVDKYAWNPTTISRTDVEGYSQIKTAIRQTWGNDTIVSPFIMTACSDARHYSEFSDKVYRFSAMHLKPEQLSMVHGDNEQLSFSQIKEQCDFFYNLMKTC